MEYDNELLFIKSKLQSWLWFYGKNVKSIRFIKKDAVINRSEKMREMFKEAANILL